MVLFQGEAKRGELEEAGFMDRTFMVIVSTGRGFVMPSDGLRETGGHKPISDLLEEARQVLRGIQFSSDTTEVTPDYKGMGIFTLPDGRPVDAWQMEFSIGVQCAAPE
jgi:hypothetical protein